MPSLDISTRAVVRFFDALGVASSDTIEWECGPYSPEGRWTRWHGVEGTRDDFLRALPQLLRLNASRACSVFLRAPAGLIYADDVTVAGIEQLRGLGVTPRAVVETSPGSHQVWLRVPSGCSAHALSVGVELAIGADSGARAAKTGTGRLGRLPGLRNTKPSRGGCWVLLRGSTTRPGAPSEERVLRDLARSGIESSSITRAAGAAGAAAKSRQPAMPAAGAIDQSRIDARHVTRMLYAGRSERECRDWLMAQPETARKGRHADDYVRRTVESVAAWVRERG